MWQVSTQSVSSQFQFQLKPFVLVHPKNNVLFAFFPMSILDFMNLFFYITFAKSLNNHLVYLTH